MDTDLVLKGFRIPLIVKVNVVPIGHKVRVHMFETMTW